MSIVYKWGNLNLEPTVESLISKISVAGKVSAIYGGGSHCFLTVEQKVYAFGSNEYGQLGSDEDVDMCQLVEPHVRTKHAIKQISCGGNHTLILDEAGDVYSCGEGAYGALGCLKGADSHSFCRILGGIVQISAGNEHSLAISKSKVYGWGNSKDNQLGLLKQKIYYEPQQLYVFQSYYCYAGSRFSFFATNQGLYATGYNEGAVLGLGHEKKVKMPKKVNFTGTVNKIRSGGDYSVIENGERQFYIAGKGCFGHFLYPTKIKHFKECESVEIGSGFGTIIHQNGAVSVWNDSYQRTPVYNQFLMSLNLEGLICQSEFCVGFSHSVGNPYTRNIMIKSVVSNENMVANPLESQKRKLSDCSKHFYGPHSHNVEQLGTPLPVDTRIRNMKQNRTQSQLRNETELASGFQLADGSQIADESDLENGVSIERGLEDKHIHCNQRGLKFYESRIGEEEGLRKSVETPLFMRKDPCVGDRGIEDSRSKQQLRQEGDSIFSLANDDLTSSANNQIVSLANIELAASQRSELTQRIQFLELENRRKDEQLRRIKVDYLDLLDIIESDMALRKIIQAKSNAYITQKRQQFGDNKKDRFTSHIIELKALLMNQMPNPTQTIQ